MKSIENMKYPIFREVPFSEQSLMQRLLKQQPEENAIIEVNNLLFNNSIKDIKSDDITALSRKYKINLVSKFSLNLEEFYAVILNFALNDKYLSEEEIDDLRHLKDIFRLNDKTIAEIHTKIGQKIYKQSFEEAVADGRLTNEEMNFLVQLEDTLKLPKSIANEISLNVRTSFFEKSYQTSIEDNRITPAEENELLAIAKSLNIKISQKDKTILERLKLYWIYENTELQEVSTDIKLQKNERCFFVENKIVWYEERELLKRKYGYSKLNQSNEIITHSLKYIDSGSIMLTSKRIVFVGLEKTTSINYDKIIGISQFKDGIEIDKETGRSPILSIGENTDIIYVILQRLIKEVV